MLQDIFLLVDDQMLRVGLLVDGCFCVSYQCFHLMLPKLIGLAIPLAVVVCFAVVLKILTYAYRTLSILLPLC